MNQTKQVSMFSTATIIRDDVLRTVCHKSARSFTEVKDGQVTREYVLVELYDGRIFRQYEDGSRERAPMGTTAVWIDEGIAAGTMVAK